MQVKTTMKYYLTPVKMAIINKSIHNQHLGEYKEKKNSPTQ